MACGIYAYYAYIKFKMSVIIIVINIIIVLTTINFEIFICITGMTIPFSRRIVARRGAPSTFTHRSIQQIFSEPLQVRALF